MAAAVPESELVEQPFDPDDYDVVVIGGRPLNDWGNPTGGIWTGGTIHLVDEDGRIVATRRDTRWTAPITGATLATNRRRGGVVWTRRPGRRQTIRARSTSAALVASKTVPRQREASGHQPVRRRGSRRTATRAGPDDPDLADSRPGPAIRGGGVVRAPATEARTCEVCGADISDCRPQARFCSGTCRGLHHRGEPYLPAGTCEVCGTGLEALRADARYCSSKCRTRADRARRERSVETATNGFHPPSKVMTPGGDPEACARCGSSAGYVDEDGDRVCFMCGRLREGVAA
jgi:predicted nucleic acid-binding Zn ribbon protein